MTNLDKSILVQVAYKGIIELIKSEKIMPINEVIESHVWKHYQMLTGLIERAQNGKELFNSDISTLEGLIYSSTLDDDNKEIALQALDSISNQADYDTLKERLEANQLPDTDNLTGKTQFKLNQELKKQGK